MRKGGCDRVRREKMRSCRWILLSKMRASGLVMKTRKKDSGVGFVESKFTWRSGHKDSKARDGPSLLSTPALNHC
jgi:hypothetical protein